MATTWIKPLHIRKDRTILQSIMGRTDYAKNPEKTVARAITDSTDYAKNSDKTGGGELVAGYACDPRAVDEDFLLTKRRYDCTVGRDQGKRNIIAYHIRQSFKPGEIGPNEALDVGYELAQRFTKGKHAYIVAVHTDKAHIHCHIVFNSTSLDCTKKFKNFWGSSSAVRRLSDLICAEHGLSVIKDPKPSKGKNYGEWLGADKKPSFTETIKGKIDEILPSCPTFEDFISALRAAGFTVKDNRRHITVCAPGQKKPARLNTLKGNYTEAAIRARLGKARITTGGGDSGTHTRVSLLVDIQAKIREGKGAGYEQWAKIFNLKQAAKTLIFLQENGIDSYEDLKKKSSSASGEFTALTTKIKEVETRLNEVGGLQKYIGQYGKTRDIYAKYKASGWSRDFYDEHAAGIILHRAAKKYFDGLGMKKLPSINQLKQEWATLAAEKKKLYSGYHELKADSRALSVAKGNADRILGIAHDAQNRDGSRGQNRRDTREM
jgi:hypothetical protein